MSATATMTTVVVMMCSANGNDNDDHMIKSSDDNDKVAEKQTTIYNNKVLVGWLFGGNGIMAVCSENGSNRCINNND